jgi:phosphatidylglycerol:prolipoprotein diacylglycerol transferase
MPLPYVHIPDGHLGPIPIHPFGVLVATGVLVGSALAVRRGARFGIAREDFEGFITHILVFGFVLSHVLDELMYRPSEAIAHPIQLLKIWAGISSYGGFVGAIVGALVWKYTEPLQLFRSKTTKHAGLHVVGMLVALLGFFFLRKPRRPAQPMLPYLEHVAAVFPVAWIFGRTGCSVAHDHPGRLSQSFLAVDFPGAPRFDLGLLEMLCTIPIAIATIWFARKPRRPGQIVGFLSLVYAPVRFLLDALRATDVSGADARYFGLTPGQWMSIALVGVGVAMFAFSRGKPPVQPKPLEPAAGQDARSALPQ